MGQLRVSLENIIPLTEARDHFSQIVTDVQKDKLYILTKGGKPAVAVIDVKYLNAITGGSINLGHIETEIQKDPSKVGRTPMIKNIGNSFTPSTPPKPMPNPLSSPISNPTPTNNYPKPTFDKPTESNKPNEFNKPAEFNKPNETKPAEPATPPVKISFEPTPAKPATLFVPANNTNTDSTPNSNQPKPYVSPYQSYKPNPSSTPNSNPSTIPTPTAFSPAAAPFSPPKPATPTPPANSFTPAPVAPLTNPSPNTSTPLAMPPVDKPYIAPTPISTPAPIPSPAPDLNSSSISVSTPTPLSESQSKPVDSPITMQNSPTNAPTSSASVPTSISSGSGLAMSPTMPAPNTGSTIDIVSASDDLDSSKPNPDSIFNNSQNQAPKPTNNPNDEPDDMDI